MTQSRRIYLDQAATSWPKLPQALAAAEDYIHLCGATSGRGVYASARRADQWISQARLQLARLVDAPQASDIALCTSGTHALNALLWGILDKGDHVLTTAIEHNSVLRPLEALRTHRAIEVSIAPCDPVGCVDLNAARLMMRPSTRAIVISHASNVTGRLQELSAWSQLAKQHGAYLLVDASQTVGYLPLSMQQLGIDALAAAGHKGLGALAGTGFLAASPEIQTRLRPLMFGGTGIASEQVDSQPQWPQTIEVGNGNLPGYAAMAAAAEHWHAAPNASLTSWRRPLTRLIQGLQSLPKADQLMLIGHEASATDCDSHSPWLPIVSLRLNHWDHHEAAAVLDANFGVEVRAGFHCAALIHSALGSQSSGGTLRLSLSHQTTEVDIDDALHALDAIL